ncbi:hypothetical protein NUH87_11195 [Pseudomonas batumici]|uniref:hypothetical protein n=1 Tax=Pseudomonas batumici TaxID=226910 RepID=UPI0030D1046C
MNINGTSSFHGYSPAFPSKISTDKSPKKESFVIEPSITNTAKRNDTVSLSHSALTAESQQKSTHTTSSMTNARELPIIDGSVIPEWLSPFYIDVSTLPGAPGYRIGQEDKFSKLSSGERTEYFSLLHTHVSNLYEQSGIDIYEAFNSKDSNEKLHQCFIKNLKGDPQLLALVNKMGIPLS